MAKQQMIKWSDRNQWKWRNFYKIIGQKYSNWLQYLLVFAGFYMTIDWFEDKKAANHGLNNQTVTGYTTYLAKIEVEWVQVDSNGDWTWFWINLNLN